MYSIAARSLALAALATIIGHSAAAQLAPPPAPAETMQTATVDARMLESLRPGPLTPADRERLDATVRRADTLVLQNRFIEANRLYWAVVGEQHAAGEYPVDALHRLASAYFQAGDDYAAANVLAELAESATEFGDPPTRLQSLFDAALMFRNAGRLDRMLECVRQIRPLLGAAAIPEATRKDIARRITLR